MLGIHMGPHDRIDFLICDDALILKDAETANIMSQLKNRN